MDTPTKPEHNIVQIPRKTVIGKLQPRDLQHSEVNNISWMTDGTTTTNKPAKIPYMPPKSSFQLKAQN